MTDLEKIIELNMKKIQVSIPCKIESLSGIYANVKPLIYDSLDFPVISSVPILYLGSASKKLKFKSSVGDIVTVFFSQLDLAKFLVSGTTGQVNSTESFNLTNAFALPFHFHSIADGEATATSDFEITGDIKVNGNIEVTGDVVASGISLVNHTHLYSHDGLNDRTSDVPQ